MPPVISTIGGMNLSVFLLVSYVTCETIRALYAYHALHQFPNISPSLIAFLSELVKFLLAIVVVIRSKDHSPGLSAFITEGKFNITDVTPYALPAGLFLINNLIYFIVLPLTSASILQVCILAKLPTTGILHHFLIKRQSNVYAWISMFCLCIGLVVFNIPSKSQSTGPVAAWYLAPVAGFVIACLSAVASISGEKLTKSGKFWESSACLYAWGVLFATLSWPVTAVLKGSSTRTVGSQPHPSIFIPVTILVFLTAGVGLVVAVLLRKKDNILKLVGTSASLVAIAASQFVLMPELRVTNFTALKACGGGIVATSTWCYNHWSQARWPPNQFGYATVVPEEEASIETDGEDKSISVTTRVEELEAKSIMDPNATKVIGCCVGIAFVTWEISRAS